MILTASAIVLIFCVGQGGPVMPSQAADSTTGAGVSIYGIEGAQGLTQGTNRIVLFISSPSQSSQDANKINFIVDRFAISGVNSNTAMLHVLSPGLPGTIDTKTDEVQVDVSKLTSSVQSANNIELSELKKMMKPGAGSVIVSTAIDTQNIGSSQTTFQVQKMAVIAADGKVSSFGMTDTDLARHLVEAAGVAAVPGSSFFHTGGETKLRFTFSKKDETLHDACKRLETLDGSFT